MGVLNGEIEMTGSSSKTGTSRGIAPLLAVLMALVLVLAACSEGFDSSNETSVTDDAGDAAEFAVDEVEAAEDAVDGGIDLRSSETAETITAAQAGSDDSDAPASDGENQTASSGETAPIQTAAQRGREIIFTASVAVGVDDVEAASAQAAMVIEDVGGFISAQNTSGGAEPRSEITFKVDPENFSEALERLAGIGELRNQTVSSDDVTERVVDLQSRIDVTQLGVERLREAMEAATDLDDFAELEALLLSREADLEVMRGTLRTLRDRIDLATITLVLEQDRVRNQVALFVSVYEGHDEGVGCPGTQISQQFFEPGDEVTLCFDARNDGDQTLTDVTVTETVLGIEGNDQLISVFGDPDDLRPGQSAIQAFELTIDRDRALRVGVTAVPTDGVSTDAAGPAVRTAGTPVIRVNEDAIDPGFGDGFSAATALLATLWTVTKVLAGFLIPLLVLVPFVVLAFWLLRKLRGARAERKEAKRMANQPPPPTRNREADLEKVAAPGRRTEKTGSDDSE